MYGAKRERRGKQPGNIPGVGESGTQIDLYIKEKKSDWPVDLDGFDNRTLL